MGQNYYYYYRDRVIKGANRIKNPRIQNNYDFFRM